MADSKAQAQANKVEKDHAKTGRPVSPTEDPKDRSVSAGAIAAQVDPKGTGGATVNAKSMDKVNKADEAKEDKEKLEEDQSIAGKLRRSELFLVTDHSLGGDPYVGISPQNDPKATPASKLRSQVRALDMVAPRTGMQVRPKSGDAFSVGEGFGLDTTPADWARVTTPDGKPFIA